MQFKVLTDEELVKFSDYPTSPGITARLMQTDKKMKERRKNTCFACKHCVPNPRECWIMCMSWGTLFDFAYT